MNDTPFLTRRKEIKISPADCFENLDQQAEKPPSQLLVPRTYDV
jgi:hypothetical protein